MTTLTTASGTGNIKLNSTASSLTTAGTTNNYGYAQTATTTGTNMTDIFNTLFGSFNSTSNAKKDSKPTVAPAKKTILFPGGIKTVHVNQKKKVVTVIFDDGSKGISRCHPNDEFDPFVGFCMAVTYALFPSRTQALKWFSKKLAQGEAKDAAKAKAKEKKAKK